MPTIPMNDLRRQYLAEREAIDEAIADVLQSGWFVHGPQHAAFEAEFRQYLGVEHCIAVANGTDALQLAMQAVAADRPGLVVTTANAGGYTAIAARAANRRVCFVDVEADTLCMSASDLESVLSTHETAAVVVTHLYGRLADMENLMPVCEKYGVPVIEDCAQSHGAGRDQRAGSYGAAGTFSFYPTKNLGALGDGGAVVTNDRETADRVAGLRQYGWSGKYQVAMSGGRNSRFDELQAAVLRTRLPLLDTRNQRRREIVARYVAAARGSRVRVLAAEGPGHVAHLAVALTDRREDVREQLAVSGIATDIHYPVPDHEQNFDFVASIRPLPVTEAVSRQIFSLPCFPELTDSEVLHVCAALTDLGSERT